MFMVQTPPPPGVDPNFLVTQLVPLIGVIAVAVIAGVVVYGFFKSDLAAAIAERIRSKIRRKGMSDTGADAIDAGHVAELEHKVIDMQGQISEMAERLDFAERLLAQKRERSLPGA